MIFDKNLNGSQIEIVQFCKLLTLFTSSSSEKLHKRHVKINQRSNGAVRALEVSNGRSNEIVHDSSTKYHCFESCFENSTNLSIKFY